MTRDAMNDVARIDNWLAIWWAKKHVNVVNEKRTKQSMKRLDSDAYTRMQFWWAVSHSMGEHTTALQAQFSASTGSSDEDDDDAIDEQQIATSCWN